MEAVSYFTDARQVALANAITRDDVPRIRELAKAGVDINARGEQSMTFPLWAITHRRKSALRAVLEAGATVDAGQLEQAVRDDDPDFLRLLLAARGDANARNQRGEPLLFTAIEEMRWMNLHILVERGADVNARGNDGATALMLLAGLNQFEEVMGLLQRGADYQAVSDTGATLAWRVQQAQVESGTPQAGWRERVLAFLKSAGVKFPVSISRQ